MPASPARSICIAGEPSLRIAPTPPHTSMSASAESSTACVNAESTASWLMMSSWALPVRASRAFALS